MADTLELAEDSEVRVRGGVGMGGGRRLPSLEDGREAARRWAAEAEVEGSVGVLVVGASCRRCSRREGGGRGVLAVFVAPSDGGERGDGGLGGAEKRAMGAAEQAM